MGPRYQCLGLSGVWSWRLLGSNHRELARAWGSFPTLELAAEDALAVGRAAAASTIEISVGADTAWRWVLSVDGEPRAASSAHYARRLECLRAVARFRDCAPVARVAAGPLVRRASGRAGVPPTGGRGGPGGRGDRGDRGNRGDRGDRREWPDALPTEAGADGWRAGPRRSR